MSKKRRLKHRGELQTYFGSEDGIHYRGIHQEMNPVIERVKRLDAQVNEAPAVGNTNDWRYLGSIPVSVLVDYLTKRNIPMDVFARNEGGVKDEFKRWLKSNRDLRKFLAQPAAKARPFVQR